MGAIDQFLNDYILGEDFKNKTGAFAPREKTKSQLKQEDLAIKRQIASDIQGGGIKNLMPMLANYTVAEPLAFIGSVLPGETFTYKNLSKKLKTPLQYDNEVVKRIFNVDLDSLEGEEKEAAINQIDSFIRKNSNVSGIAEAASFLVGGGFGTKAGTKAGATARKLKDPAYADELTPNMFKPNNSLPLPSVGAKVADQPYSTNSQFAGIKAANEARQGDKLVTLQNLIKEANKNLDNTKTFKDLALEAGYQPLSVTGKKFTDKVGVTLNKPVDNIKNTFQKSFNENAPVENFYSLRTKTIEKVTGGTRGPRKENAVNWDDVPQWKKNEKFLKHIEKPENFNKYSGLTFKEAKDIWKGRTKNGKFTYKDIGAGYSSPEMKIIEYARRHVERGGDKIKFTVPITEETMASYNKAKFTYNGKEYSLNSLKQNSRQDSNFDNFYKTFDSLKTIATTRVIHPVTKKEINFDKLMEETYKKATGKNLRFGEIDHISGVKNNPFDNLRVLDQRTNISSGNIKHFADRSKAGTLNKQTERYSKDNAEKMLEKIGSNYNKKDNEFVKDGVKLAYDVLVKGRTLDTPLQVATKKFGFKLGGAVKPKRGLVDEPGGYAGLEEIIGGTYFETLEEEKRKEKEEERKSLLAEQDEGTFITRAGLGIYEEIGKATDQIEKTSESIMEEARERLNPSRPVKIKPSEILKLGESPLVKAPIALPWTVYNNLLRVTGDAYNAVSGKDLDVEKEFPYTFKMQEYITKSVGKTPDDQDYISFFDEINRMQETGFARLGFNIVDLAASIPDLALDTNFTERVQQEYDKAIKNGTFSEPETFIGKIGAIAIEFGVPGSQAFKFANFLRRAFKGNRVANYLGKTKTGKYISDVAARVGTGATTFALTDFVSGGPYNTVSEEFADNPLLLDETLNYEYENTEGLSGKDLVKANFKNRLRFGAEGAIIGGAFPIVGPALWSVTKNGLLKPLTVGGKIGGQQIPGVGSIGVQLVDQAVVQPATYLLSKTPGVSTAVGGVKMFGEFLGKDVMTRAAVKAMGANPGYIKQLPDFKDWRMFKVTSDDPLEANLKKIDNFFSYFRDSAKQTADEFYITKTTEQGIKGKSRDVEKHLDSIEVKAYELANKFKARYNTAKTSPAGEEKILEDVLDYLKGSIKLNQLPKELQEIAKSLSKTFDDIKVSFKNELPKDGGGQLQELNSYLNTNLKQYIRQSFAAFTNPQFNPAPEAMEALVEFIKMQIKNDSLLVETAMRNSNLPREQAITNFARQNAKQVLQTVKAEGVDPIVQLQKIAKENLGLEDLKIRTGEEMPDVVKRFLGEEKDLRGQIMATTASLVTQSSNAKMYNDLTASMLKSGRLFDTKEAAMAAGILNPQLVGKVKGLGMLEDVTDIGVKYADPEIANVLRGSRGMLDTLMENGVYQGLIAYKAGVQTGKTVLSPATQGRNFISAGAFPLNMGHIGGKASLGDAIKITMDDIFGAGKIADEAAVIKDISRKIELGVLDENIVSSELTAVLNDIKSGKVSTLGQITNRVDSSKLMKTATRLYAGGDNVWKWYGHEYLKSQYKGVFKNLDEAKREFTRISGISPEYIKATNLHEAIEELSAHVLRETYPTYSKVPPVIQAIRKIPFIGNFVSFPAEIFRTSVATSASAMKNIASPNAQIRAMGYRTLMGQSLTLGGLNEAIKATGHLMTDVNRDQIEIAKEEFLPEYMRDSQLVPITNIKDGKFKAFDLSRFLPYDIVSTTAANLMGRAVDMEGLDPQKIENDVLQEYFKAVGPMLDVLNGSFFGIAIGYEPAADLLFRGGRTKTGTAIYSDSDLMQEKIDKVLMHFANNAEPGALRTLQNLYNAAQGDVTGTGQPIEAKDEVFKMFGGSSVPIDILGGYGFKINEFQNTFKDARVSEGWYSPKDWRQRDGAQLAREYKNQNLEALREQYNFYRLSKKALESGLLTQKQIYPILAERLGKKTAARVLSGYFTPLSYGEGGLKRRYQNVKRGNPKEEIELQEFMPLGKLEQIKGEFSTFKFSDFEKEIEGQEKAPSGSLQDLLNSQSNVTPPVQEPQVPPLPDSGTPIVNPKQTASVAGTTVSPRTGLTDSESVLLSPTDQLYRRRQRGIT